MITDGENYWINSTGNAGMATAGSGDVLTGMLTGLRAQGYSAVEAACLGVFLHGYKVTVQQKKWVWNALLHVTFIALARFLPIC